ncbi:MAG: branched-chain amino acid ABC transporter permease [Desulfomonilaceae bacterium]|nr:branched-chain amino acid ABC transporter permease [Desulfomonilaceae bacterium]
MSFQFVIMQLFNGLILGSLYVLLALGLSIIFGTLGIINFAHGAFFMLGAYTAYTIMTFLVPNFWVALICVPAIMALFGAACEVLLFRRLYAMPPLYIMLLTFGLMLVIQDVVRMVFGSMGVPFPTPESLSGAVNLGFMYYPKYRLFLIAITAACSIAVWLFLTKTRLGAVIRAGTDNSQMVDALGIDINRIITLVVALGTGLAGLAGVLAAPIQNVRHLMGMDFLVDCFVVVVIGGMGSIAGSIVGGLIVGEIISVGVMVWPPMANTLIYLFMAAFLLARPRGLFGREAFHD